MTFPIRINKYLADQGLTSRREADAMISAKQVLINGVPAKLGAQVKATDVVTLASAPSKKRYLAYYKGRGVISHSPGENEVDIATRLKKDFNLSGISPIGRLDKDSEGLLLLSDDGRITGRILNPDQKLEKEYQVTVDKKINGFFTKMMATGVDIEGYHTKPAQITTEPDQPYQFNLILTEGKKHQIRRMCAALGYQVKALKRIRIGPITLGKIKPNQFRELTETERKKLFVTIGLAA